MLVALLANPVSGRGAGPGRARELVQVLERRGHRTELHLGQDRADAVQWARAAAATAERLVVVGGDGSLSAVVDGLPESPPPIALLPIGTSNLLGKEWRLPRKPEQLADMIEHGEVRLLDTARVNQRRSFAVFDFGLGGELMRRMEERRTGAIRKSQYFPLIWTMMREWEPKPQRVTADGEDLGEFDYGIVAGVRSYASSVLRLGPADYSDGLWELYLFRRVGVARGAWLGVRALTVGVKGARFATCKRVRSVQVSGLEPTPVQIDGDYAGTTPVEFEVSDFQLPLLVPGSAAVSS